MKKRRDSLTKCQVERDLMALGWGFAEATFFFIVPDVLLSRIVLKSPRACWRACLFALAGALAGGAIMYAWGAASPASAVWFLDRIPAISQTMIVSAAADLERQGLSTLFRGALNGVPYKIYAVHAGSTGVSFGLFMLIGAAARWGRFLLVCAAIWIIKKIFLARLSMRTCLRIHLAGWTLFYLYYFIVMEN